MLDIKYVSFTCTVFHQIIFVACSISSELHLRSTANCKCIVMCSICYCLPVLNANWNLLTNFQYDFPVLGLMNIGVAFFRLLATGRHDDVNGCFYTAICCKSSKRYLLKHFFLRQMRPTTFRYYLGLMGGCFYVMFLSLVYSLHQAQFCPFITFQTSITNECQ